MIIKSLIKKISKKILDQKTKISDQKKILDQKKNF